MELEITGRNLPRGETFGERFALLRKRRDMSQREAAAFLGISQPTLVTLEVSERGRVETLEKAETLLGAGLHLVARGAPKDFYTHAGQSSVWHKWRTPAFVLDRLYRAVGRFDLDPCSPTHERKKAPVKAAAYFTERENGLALQWFGVVFLNPPYKELGKWLHKARTEVEKGHAETVIALVPVRSDTSYWHDEVLPFAEVLYLRGRLCFGDSDQPASFPSALVVWGVGEGMIERMRREFDR